MANDLQSSKFLSITDRDKYRMPRPIVVKFELYELYFWLELYEL